VNDWGEFWGGRVQSVPFLGEPIVASQLDATKNVHWLDEVLNINHLQNFSAVPLGK
jgi:hypothetical protein